MTSTFLFRWVRRNNYTSEKNHKELTLTVNAIKDWFRT